jgi:hypothetical protein
MPIEDMQTISVVLAISVIIAGFGKQSLQAIGESLNKIYMRRRSEYLWPPTALAFLPQQRHLAVHDG